MSKQRKMRNHILLSIGLCLVIALAIEQKKNAQEKAQAKEVGVFFFRSLIGADRALAMQYTWPNAQLYEALKNPNYFSYVKDAKNLQVVSVSNDSAQSRPAYYQDVHKVMSVMVKFKVVHTDSEHPVSDDILFITLVKEFPQAQWRVTELGSGP